MASLKKSARGHTGVLVPEQTEAVMRNALRGFFGLSVLLSLMGVLPGAAMAQGNSAACGTQPGDADQIAAVRATAEEQCDCASASSHDEYVSCVDEVTEAAVENGSLRPQCSGAVMQCAAQSTCGKPGFVTCCQTDATGKTTCSIKQAGKDCKAPRGGTACVGSVPSCCDACAGGSCAGGTTTTTVRAPTTTTAAAGGTTTSAAGATTTTSAPVVTTTTTIVTTTTTTTLAGCCGFSPKPSELNFTTGIGAGNCGTVQNSLGTVTKQLACGGLFTGGGSNSVPLPYAVPDMGSSLTGVSACSGTTLTLTNIKSSDPGANNRNCTSVGCLFGPPLPIPNPGSTPTSVCVINSVTANASGSADCSSGASSLSLPLNSEIFLTGDLFPNAPGIQVCPV